MKTVITFLVILFFFNTGVICQNNPPIAINDTVSCFFGQSLIIYPLRNDNDPDNDTIRIHSAFGLAKVNDSTLLFHYNNNSELGSPYDTIASFKYFIRDEHGVFASAYIIINLKGAPKFDFLDINNISALVSPFGNHFWDFDKARFEVPKGSGKTAVFNQALWVGGKDSSDALHFAGERYRQGPGSNPAGIALDYSAGPIASLYDTSYLLKWNRVWKLKISEILFHRNNWNTPGYIPIDVIAKWPANGNDNMGQMHEIAPFHDMNADGIYDPGAGDYPLIRGDEAVFFILNDSAQIHSETTGNKLGVEIHGMAYAFDRPDDSVLINTIFFHYDIINRSSMNYHDAYIGLFTDFDLGFADDDFIGCDVANGSVYAYNGDSIDGNGQAWAYGSHPPVIALKIIGGPFLEPDNLDNPKGGCDNSINGLNFGNGIADDERYGLQKFINTHNICPGCPQYMTDPEFAIDYYNLMRGIWKDGTSLIYGGNGHPNIGGYGPSCNYMYPGTSDPCNWGTGGLPPNGEVNWTETSAGNAPSDRRGITSVGPVNILAGQSVPFDYCFNYSRDYTGDQQSALQLMRDRLGALNPLLEDLIKFPDALSGIKDQGSMKQFRIYPNPARENITVVSPENSNFAYQVYDLNGRMYISGLLNPGTNQLNIRSLAPGVYILKSNNQYARIIVMH